MTEIPLLYCNEAKTGSLYIHWPFCPYRCHFCPFVAFAGQDQFMEQYHAALKKEIISFAQDQSQRLSINTIFFGGGTPSTYPNNLLLDMLGILRKEYDLLPSLEMTIEVNPGTVKPGQLAVWKEGGINRLSIGVQSLNDHILKGLNRHQSARDVRNLLDEAHHLFENMSIDLILGLPGISEIEWKQMLEEIVTWPIKHISVYFLTVHEHTQLYYKVASKQITLPVDDTIVDLYYWTRSFLMEHQFLQYELSNFARPGYESKHNSAYWDRVAYRGFGVGACSFDGKSRFENEKNLMLYLQKAELGADAVIKNRESLTNDQIYLEKIMLGLRRSRGIPDHELTANLTLKKEKIIRERLHLLKQEGFIHQESDSWKLTAAGLAVENDILARLSC